MVSVSSLFPTSRDGGLRNKTGVTSDNQKHTVEKVSTKVEKTYSSAMAFQLKLKRHIRLAAFLSIGPFHDLIRSVFSQSVQIGGKGRTGQLPDHVSLREFE